jgi:hypothetical protein
MNNVEIIDNRGINTKFIGEFSALTGLVGRRNVKEIKLLPAPKRERFSLIEEEQEGINSVGRIVKGEFKAYFNVNEHSNEIIARVYQEEGKEVKGPEERITHAEDYLESRIITDKWKYNRHSKSEKVATKEIFNLMTEGFDLVVWISPKSNIYEEARLNIMLPGVENGKNFFDPWGIPIPHNWKESVELGNKLLDEGGKINGEARMLREQPIGYKLMIGENWIEKCEELMPEMKWAWDFIKSGKVDENMKKLALKIKEAKKIAKGDNVVFEKVMMGMGYKLNVSGNHGGSWLSGEMGNGVGVIIVVTAEGISYRIGSTEGLTLCEKCGCWHSGTKCPICD